MTSSGKSDKSREMIRDRPTFPQSGRSQTDPRSDGEDWCGREIEVASPQRTGSCRWRRTHCSVTDDNQVGAWLFIEVRQSTRFTHGQKRGAADIENVHDFAGAAAVATGVSNERWKKTEVGGGHLVVKQWKRRAVQTLMVDTNTRSNNELQLSLPKTHTHGCQVGCLRPPPRVVAQKKNDEHKQRVYHNARRVINVLRSFSPRHACSSRCRRLLSPTVTVAFVEKLHPTQGRVGQGRVG